MPLLAKFALAFKALPALGFPSLGLYTWYQFTLRSGLLRKTNLPPRPCPGLAFQPALPALPEQQALLDLIGAEGLERLLAEADEIIAGKVRLFGAAPVPLELSLPGPLRHWTDYERGIARVAGSEQSAAPLDWKFIWEPARFGWAITLGRAYHLSGRQGYAQAFWRYTETFLDANPAYQGPHWTSAQEVALRLVALTFAAQVFAPSPASTPARMARLARALAEHAGRIPSTLAYARAQNNNHLLSEAVGLCTAARVLPGHPHAPRWQRLGLRWLRDGLLGQIAADGAYIQHSANYHRLMLQLALWARAAARPEAPWLEPPARGRLAAAVRWLAALLDEASGQVPNLGPNDGAYILPLTGLPFADYRPVLQAAARAFLGGPLLPAGPWDEMSLWLGQLVSGGSRVELPAVQASPATLRIPAADSWAYLRAASFTARPGHVDQLHLDLWWQGLNIAQDAGTYRYTAASPWENALASTFAHNTLSIAGQEQMRRAGRFLYLDWAQAQIVEHARDPQGDWERLSARHDGYRRLGLAHQRTVTAFRSGRWLVEDAVLPLKPVSRLEGQEMGAWLHWLLPDWPVVLQAGEAALTLRLESPRGPLLLKISAPPGLVYSLLRAGEIVSGSGSRRPIWGWVSPTYSVKVPALSLVVQASGPLPLALTSEWVLPSRIPEATL